MTRATETNKDHRDRVVICGVILPGHPKEFDGELSEVRALVGAADGDVVGETYIQRRDRPHPATLMGRGKVEEVHEEVQLQEPDAVVVDNELTPAQVRNLEKVWGVRVVDRSELILDIFSRRAQTRQARLQVELAQNEYLLPRLRRMWTHLERMEGAIGTRGPGETQLETDRRLLNKRVTDLKRELATIKARKERQVSTRAAEFKVGLVGYTNAGKSSILNYLTGSEEFAANMPFATLDTRTRRWVLPNRRTVLLSDTVGFLQRLPHHLVASFHATLEETLQADILVHVVDASHPDAPLQMRAVDEVLASLSPRLEPEFIALNKVDLVQDPIQLQLLLGDRSATVIHTSVKTGEGLERLTNLISVALDARSASVRVEIPLEDGRTIAMVRAHAAVSEESCEEGLMIMHARCSPGALGVIKREAGDAVRFVVEGK